MNKLRKLTLTSVLMFTMAFSVVGCSSTVKTTDATTKPAATETAKPAATDAAKSGSSAVEKAANDYFANMPADSYKIAEKDFVEKVKAGDKTMLAIDIRTAEDYAKGHIKGAVNIPWGTAISDNLDKLPTDKTLYVYCYTGQTAGQTVALLNMAGFTAKSVNLGWTLGIAKVEGIAALTETAPTAFTASTSAKVNADVKTAITKYYAGLADVNSTIYKFYKIGEDDLKKFVDAKDSSIYILSVRKAADYAAGHIQGALNIPYGAGMEKSFNTLPKDKKIVVYCYTGQTAGQVVAGLRMLGYDAVSLNAGMGMASTAPAGWANKGFPVVK
jgi:rhodanese-related sulfurtransferase